MIFNFIFILLNFIFSFFILKISLYIPINYIYGSAFSYLKFFNGVFPAAFSNFNYPIILFLVFFKLGFLKIATIFSGFIYLLNKKNYLFLYRLTASLILIFSILYFIKNTTGLSFLYAIPWIISLLMLFFKNNKFILSFICIWISHAIGTIYQIFLGSINSEIFYLNLIPISICERSILIISLFIFNIIFEKFKINLNYLLKKTFLKKNINLEKK